MTLLLVIGGIVLGIIFAVGRALALEEIQGRIQRRVGASVERTIASMPKELQAEWGDEWRAELAAIRGMPLSSLAFARGLQRTASKLIASSALVPAGSGGVPLRRGQFLARSRMFKRFYLRMAPRKAFGLILGTLLFLQVVVMIATTVLGIDRFPGHLLFVDGVAAVIGGGSLVYLSVRNRKR